MNFCRLCASNCEQIDLFENFPCNSELVDDRSRDINEGQDLNVLQCRGCGHIQLEKDFHYESYSSYHFQTSGNLSGKESDEFVRILSKYSNTDSKTVLEIGCNDFELLSRLKGFERRIGVDPSSVSKEKFKRMNESQSPTTFEFIPDTIENIPEDTLRSADLIISRHNLEHINDLNSVISKISRSVKQGTLFVVEVPDAASMLNNRRMYQIFPEHIHYFSASTLRSFMNFHGFCCLEISLSERYGGSIIAVFQRAKLSVENESGFVFSRLEGLSYTEAKSEFASRMSLLRQRLERTYGKNYCYGAGHALPAIAYHIDGTLQLFEAVYDDDPSKTGLRYASIAISISRPDSLCEDQTVLVTSPDHFWQIESKILRSGSTPLRLV